MILLDFSKPLIFMDLGGFVNKLQTSSKIKVTGQRTLLSKSSFVTSLFVLNFYRSSTKKGRTTPQCSGRKSIFQNYGLSTERKPTMDFNFSPSLPSAGQKRSASQKPKVFELFKKNYVASSFDKRCSAF